jgi:hypothetical protein
MAYPSAVRQPAGCTPSNLRTNTASCCRCETSVDASMPNVLMHVRLAIRQPNPQLQPSSCFVMLPCVVAQLDVCIVYSLPTHYMHSAAAMRTRLVSHNTSQHARTAAFHSASLQLAAARAQELSTTQYTQHHDTQLRMSSHNQLVTTVQCTTTSRSPS